MGGRDGTAQPRWVVARSSGRLAAVRESSAPRPHSWTRPRAKVVRGNSPLSKLPGTSAATGARTHLEMRLCEATTSYQQGGRGLGTVPRTCCGRSSRTAPAGGRHSPQRSQGPPAPVPSPRTTGPEPVTRKCRRLAPHRAAPEPPQSPRSGGPPKRRAQRRVSGGWCPRTQILSPSGGSCLCH